MTDYNHEATLKAALFALQNGQMQEAQRLSRLATKNNPEDAEGWSILGLTLDGEDGGQALKKAIEIEPQEPRWHLHLGNGLMSREDFGGAQNAFAKSAELSRGHPSAMTAWGNSLMALERFADAAQVYHRALQAQPSSDLWVKAGDALMGARDTINAAKAYERAHTDNQRPAAMNAKLADIHIMLNQYADAQKFNDAVLLVSPEDPDAGLRAANLLRWSGDHQAAINTQQKFWLKNQNHPGLIAALLDDRDENVLDTALTLADNSAAEQTGRRRVCFALARHFDRVKDEAKAWKFAENANTLYDDGIVYDGAAEHRAQLEKAISAYKSMPEPAPLRPKMIYVMGPPRCGGSLLQTILCKSEGVVSAGERGALMSWLIPGLDNPFQLTQNAAQLAHADIMGMQSANGPGDVYVDKTSPHIIVAGLLSKIHAGAQFVLPERNREDMLVSMFFHDFPTEFAYTRSIQGITDYLDFQDEAARAWREAGLNIINHNHDEFITAPAVHGRSLFESLGLVWSDDMLTSSGSDTVVRTFSARQVRGGVTQKYAGRGERYAKYLQPVAK